MDKNSLKKTTAYITSAAILLSPTTAFAQNVDTQKEQPKKDDTKKVEKKADVKTSEKPKNKEEAQKALDEITAIYNKTKEDLDKKVQYMFEAQKDLKLANSTLENVNKEIAKLKTQGQNAVQSEKDKATKEVTKLQNKKTELERQVSDYNKTISKLKDEKTVLQNRLKTAEDALKQAESMKSPTKEEIDDAKRELDNLAKLLKDKEAEANALDKQIKELEESLDYQDQVMNLQKANKAEAAEKLETAKKNQQAAQRLYEDQKSLYDQALKEHYAGNEATGNEDGISNKISALKEKLNTLKTQKQEIQSSIESTTKNKELLEQKLKIAENNYNDAINKNKSAQSNKSVLKDELDGYIGQKNTLEAKISALEREIEARKQATNGESKDQRIDQLRNEIKDLDNQLDQITNTIKKAEKDRDAQLEKGALGFYESNGSENAVLRLTKNKTYWYWTETVIELPDMPKEGFFEDATHIGNPKDATSLDNVYKALSFADQANIIRKRLNKPEFKINDDLMVDAQIAANWANRYSETRDGVGTKPSKSKIDKAYNEDRSPLKGQFNLAEWNKNAVNPGDPIKDGDRVVISDEENELGKPVGESKNVGARSPFYTLIYRQLYGTQVNELTENKDIDGDGIIGPVEPETRSSIIGYANRNDNKNYMTYLNPDMMYTGIGYANYDTKVDKASSDSAFFQVLETKKPEKYNSMSDEDFEAKLNENPGSKTYTVSEYRAKLDEYVKNVKDKADAIIKPESEKIQDIKNQKAQKQEEINILTNPETGATSLENLEKQLNTAKAELQTVNENIPKTEQKIKDNDALIKETETNKAKFEKEYNEAKAGLDKAQKDIEQLKSDLNTKANEIASVEKEIELYEKAVSGDFTKDPELFEIAQLMLKYEKDLNDAKEKVKEADYNYGRVKDTFDAEQKKFDMIKGQIDDKTAEKKVVAAKVVETKTFHDKALVKYNLYTNKDKAIADAKKNIETINASIKEIDGKINTIETSINSVKKDLTKLENETIPAALSAKEKADKLKWENENTAEIKDKDFSYINNITKELKEKIALSNTYTENVKKAETALASAKEEKVKAEKVNAKALADKTIAESELAKFQDEEGTETNGNNETTLQGDEQENQQVGTPNDNAPGKGNIETGDNSNIVLLSSSIGIAIATLFGIFKLKRRKKLNK